MYVFVHIQWHIDEKKNSTILDVACECVLNVCSCYACYMYDMCVYAMCHNGWEGEIKNLIYRFVFLIWLPNICILLTECYKKNRIQFLCTWCNGVHPYISHLLLSSCILFKFFLIERFIFVVYTENNHKNTYTHTYNFCVCFYQPFLVFPLTLSIYQLDLDKPTAKKKNPFYTIHVVVHVLDLNQLIKNLLFTVINLHRMFTVCVDTTFSASCIFNPWHTTTNDRLFCSTTAVIFDIVTHPPVKNEIRKYKWGESEKLVKFEMLKGPIRTISPTIESNS